MCVTRNRVRGGSPASVAGAWFVLCVAPAGAAAGRAQLTYTDSWARADAAGACRASKRSRNAGRAVPFSSPLANADSMAAVSPGTSPTGHVHDSLGPPANTSAWGGMSVATIGNSYKPASIRDVGRPSSSDAVTNSRAEDINSSNASAYCSAHEPDTIAFVAGADPCDVLLGA